MHNLKLSNTSSLNDLFLLMFINMRFEIIVQTCCIFQHHFMHLFAAIGITEEIGITEQNLSILKTGKAKAIRFSTLETICHALDCEPGDLLKFERFGEEN
jgi:putative transcriptional regulator